MIAYLHVDSRKNDGWRDVVNNLWDTNEIYHSNYLRADLDRWY